MRVTNDIKNFTFTHKLRVYENSKIEISRKGN